MDFFWLLNVNHGKSIGILHRIATPCCSVATPFRQSCQGWDPGRTDVLEDGADVLQAILQNPSNKGWMTNRECLFHTKSTSTNILVNIKQVYPYTVYIYIILKVPYLYNIYIAIIFRDIHTSIIYHMVIQNWLSHSDDPESGSDPPSHLWFRWFSQRRPPVFRGIFCIISRGCCSVFHCFWLYVEGFSIVFPWFSMF